MERLQNYLSCEINISDDKIHAWLGQPHLVKILKSKFEKLINKVWSHKTQVTPKFLIVRPTEDIKKILVEDQQIYQSGVGMLLYLVKQSWINLANVSRELSKANDSTNLGFLSLSFYNKRYDRWFCCFEEASKEKLDVIEIGVDI